MSIPCGILCLAYVLKWFGKDFDVITLSSRLNSSSEIMWIADLGRIVMEYGLCAHLTCTSVLLDPSWFHSKSLLRDMVAHCAQTEKGMRKQAHTALLNFLEKGGTLEYRPVTRLYLETSLKHKKMIIACVSSAIFHEDPHRSGGHYLIVSGITDRIWVLNPEIDTLIEKPITEETFFSALKSWGNWILLTSLPPSSL